MKKNTFKRLLSVIVSVAMLLSMAMPAMAEETDSVTFTKVDNSSVTGKFPGREPVELPQEEAPYGDEETVRVSIFLEKAGTLEAGFNSEDIALNNAAMTYRENLNHDQKIVIQKIENVTNEELDVVWNVTLAANLISAYVKYGQIDEIEAVDGVRNVVIETRYAPDVATSGGVDPNMATSSEQVGATASWAAGYTGAGSRVAIIDTGLDLDHEAFNASAFNYSLAHLAGKNGMTPEEYAESLDLLDVNEIRDVLKQLNAYKRLDAAAADFYFNDKVPFGFNYVDVNLNLSHYNSEHGSHVAGISAANAYVVSDDGFENALTTTHVQGIAPDAQLLVMKVFGNRGGAYDSDYMVAIEDAIILGADSVNLSLGSANPGMSRSGVADYQAILDSLVNCGVVVTMSAGNSGAWMENSENQVPYLYLDDVSFHAGGSPGTYTNSLGVASVNNAGFTLPYFMVGDSMVPYAESVEYGNAPMATIGGTYEYVLLNSIGTDEEFAALGEELLAGKIAMCYRGTTSFFEKANAAMAMGAAGVVIVNNQSGIIYLNLTGYEYTAPVVSVTQADGVLFQQNGTAVTDEAGNVLYWTGTMDISTDIGSGMHNSDYYTMSAFSSWGVPGSLVMKPEITAPGGEIYSVAGYVPNLISGHNNYELMSGTSMAAPQVAGMVAVLAQYIRENDLVTKTGLDERTLAQSLLMSTAEPILDENTGYYYPVLQQGSGLANVGNATTADSYILMNADATASYADGKVKAELGDDPAKEGVYSFSFTINNLTDLEKTFALSADVFTQDAFFDGYDLYLDTWATDLAPTLYWAVNGVAVDSGAALKGLDFNGDGTVNSDDGQALLDYATGVVTELSNKDKADLNEDGVIGSYDSYLFFDLLNNSGATVAPNGTATVTVTIDLSTYDRQWLANYPNGAYIEAYVYAESLSTSEGVEGTVHSIPVLGFYGNWSDASMYDKGSVMEYTYDLETRAPYLYKSVLSRGNSNGLLITYNDAPGSQYWFGGNPIISDETYMPERNAISAVNGDMLTKLGFTTIRNAAAANFRVWNSETGELYVDDDMTGGEPLYSAFYYVNQQKWEYTYWQIGLNYNAEGIPNNTPIQVGITAALEYYVDENGNVDWDALGEGATFSMPMVVDNEAPVLNNVSIDKEALTLTAEVADNQHIAAVILYDSFGYPYTYEGSQADAEAGDTLTYVLDLTGVNGSSFLLQVYDYANNLTTYRIETQIGDVVDTIEGIELSETEIVLLKDQTHTLIAEVTPVNASNRAVIWTTSDEEVAAVDENGVVTAIAPGNAVITATAAADETVSQTCAVTVIEINTTLHGVLQDAEGNPMQFTWDLANSSEWVAGNAIEPYLENAAYDAYRDTMFVQASDSMLMYQIDPNTGETIAVSEGAAEFGAPCYDMAVSFLFGDEQTSNLFGVYDGYFLGPVVNLDNTFSRGWNLASYLAAYTGASRFVAIAEYGYDYSDGVYSDVYLALDNSGTLWVLYYDGTSSLGLDLIGTDLNLPYTQHSKSQYCSMISDANGDLYLSHFNGSTNEIYYLTFNSNTGVFESLYVGNVGADVWPAALTYAEVSGDSATSADRFSAKAEMVATIGVERLATVEAEAVQLPVETEATGSLNASANYEAPARPMSDTGVSADEGTVTVTVTAQDVTGADVDSTNGVATVTYDADSLTLESIQVEGDYISVNIEEGTVTFGYVDMDGIAAGDAVATLVFQVNSTEAETITVFYDETNDEQPGFGETMILGYEHIHTEIVGAKDATCTESGYTGDIYCTDCGKLIAEGEVIPATAHADCETVGAKDATCTEDGYTGDVCCADCGEVILEGKVIPATGHQHTTTVLAVAPTCGKPGYTGDVYCTDCTALVEKGKVIPATGEHTYSGEYDTDCDVCGHVREVKIETVAMFRLYNPNSGEHFYTGSVEERDALVSVGWTYEGVAWNAPVIGAPVYRLYNPNAGDHHYTMSEAEVAMLVDLGWHYEGVAWNSASAEEIPLFRLYNPNAEIGNHHYTSSVDERDWLVDLGWILEGIGWFGMLN